VPELRHAFIRWYIWVIGGFFALFFLGIIFMMLMMYFSPSGGDQLTPEAAARKEIQRLHGE